jgi:hypothetical protein
MSKRTIRDFALESPIWPQVDQWAQESSFALKRSDADTRLYQRGHGFFTAPMMLEVTQARDQIHVEAWVAIGFLARMQSLFILPAEMGIESGGFRAVLPRSTARTAINKLLARFDQQAIP